MSGTHVIRCSFCSVIAGLWLLDCRESVSRCTSLFNLTSRASNTSWSYVPVVRGHILTAHTLQQVLNRAKVQYKT